MALAGYRHSRMIFHWYFTLLFALSITPPPSKRPSSGRRSLHLPSSFLCYCHHTIHCCRLPRPGTPQKQSLLHIRPPHLPDVLPSVSFNEIAKVSNRELLRTLNLTVTAACQESATILQLLWTRGTGNCAHSKAANDDVGVNWELIVAAISPYRLP